MPAKRCIETKNMCLLFVDYCKVSFIPKGKFKNGYRKKKWIEIPKRKGKWTGNLLLENEIGKI